MLHFPILGNISVILKTTKFIMLLEHQGRLYYSGRVNSIVYQCQLGLEWGSRLFLVFMWYVRESELLGKGNMFLHSKLITSN